MDQPTASGSETAPSGDRGVDELAREKLQLETQILRFRSKLEEEKLRTEIRELHDAPRRTRRTTLLSVGTTALTAATTLMVALVGGFITLQVQGFADRQKRSEEYSNLLTNLGSSNVSTRAGAVVGLVRSAVEDRDRSNQTITILVTQLGSEEDARVLQILIPGIVSIGRPALNEVVRANRIARKKYVRDVQALVAGAVKPPEYYTKLPNGQRGSTLVADARRAFLAASENVTAKLNTDLLDDGEDKAIATVARELNGIGEYLPSILMDIAYGDELNFGLMQVLRYRLPSTKRDDAALTKEALTLFNTSIALGRLIRTLSGSLKNEHLEDTAILVVNFRDVSLEGAHLQGAFIAGDATGSNMTGANLRNARVAELVLEEANLSFADLAGALISPSVVHRHHYASIKLTGANWWDTKDAITASWIQGIAIGLSDDHSLRYVSIGAFCGDGEESSREGDTTRFTVLYCPLQVEAARRQLENMFPRQENEQARKEWLKAQSAL